MSSTKFGKNEFIACCGSTKFAEQMVANGPFLNYNEAVAAANDIWFNKVDVSGWLEAFAAHPQIGQNPSATAHKISANWSKGEQFTALATATDSTLQELYEWNSRYMQKFGFVFLICASGRSTPEILSELKVLNGYKRISALNGLALNSEPFNTTCHSDVENKRAECRMRRFSNRPIVEFENAAQEQMKITELRLQKLFSNKEFSASTQVQSTASDVTKAEGRVTILGSHLTAPLTTSDTKSAPKTTRTRPPITTHVLDVARGCPASGIEVMLEMYSGANLAGPVFGNVDNDKWILHGSSTTDKDGRSGQLMKMVNDLSPGVYRISFNTGKYNPHGFFPFVSIVFEIKESQKNEHFHVPLLLSPFSFSTYRGS